MRYVYITLLFILCLILQSTVFSIATVAGIKPDLVLILVVLFALIRGSREGAVVGFIGGLLQDLLLGHFIGLNILPKMAVGVIFGMLEKKVYKENFFIPVITVIIATTINESIIFLLGLTISGFPTNYFSIFRDLILPLIIYNSCLTPFVYPRFFRSLHKGVLRNPEY